MSAGLLTSHDRGVLRLTLSRVAQRNALDSALYDALSDEIGGAADNAEIRVIVITGDGGCFTAGNDLRDFQAERPTGDSPAIRFLRTIAATPVPVIAAVEGFAIGIGVTMLLHCDAVFAAENTVMQLPFVSLGLCPEGGSSMLLPQRVGAMRANDWLMSARRFDGAEAAQAGLITAATPPGETLQAAEQMARLWAAQPRDALRLTKHMLKRDDQAAVDNTLQYEATQFAARLKTDEAQLAFKAFFAKKAKA